ncbi:MAG: hypothetical protein U0Z44_06795 [Kouleothrix sp.]
MAAHFERVLSWPAIGRRALAAYHEVLARRRSRGGRMNVARATLPAHLAGALALVAFFGATLPYLGSFPLIGQDEPWIAAPAAKLPLRACMATTCSPATMAWSSAPTTFRRCSRWPRRWRFGRSAWACGRRGWWRCCAGRPRCC